MPVLATFLALFYLEVRHSRKEPGDGDSLGIDGEEGGDAKRDPLHGLLRLEPEGVPRDAHNEDGGHVRIDEEVPEQPLEGEDDPKAGESAGGVVSGAVLSLDLGQVHVGELEGAVDGHLLLAPLELQVPVLVAH